MRASIVPFGPPGWKEKKRLLEEIISSRPHPPFLYNDVLILVSSSRTIRLYGRLFLEAAQRIHGASSLVQPEIQTLHQFLQKRYAGLPAARLIDENSRLVLLEGLVKEGLAGNRLFDQDPDLLAPALSSVLAKMIEQLSSAEVGPGDLLQKITGTECFGKAQVALLIDIYGRYREELRKANLVDPAGMHAHLRDHFAPVWLAPYTRILIDGVQPAGALETEILKKMMESAACTILVDAPSKDLVDHAPEFHPLRIVREFLSSLGIVAENSVPAERDYLYLASTLFSSRSFSDLARNSPAPSSFSKDLHLLSAVNSREEVSFIAAEVKESIRKGTRPDSILVAFPALDEYAGLVEEIFNDYGIPYNRGLGRQLSSSAVAAATISLLRSCQEDFSCPSLLRVFASPFLRFSDDHSLSPALDRFIRERSIPGGKQKLLSALKYRRPDENGKDNLSGRLNELFAALEPFSGQDSAPLSAWMDRLSALVDWSGMADGVARIKGPLNVNLQAYNKLRETITALNRAGKTFPDYRYTFNEWFFLFRKTVMHARFQVPPEDEGGVQIMGIEESLSSPWNEIYLGGLIDAHFPQRLPQNIFLPEQTLESMGIRTLERARLNASYHFYRLLLSADRAVLTYPESYGDRPAVPSPFLQELVPLAKAGLLNRGRSKTSGIQFSLRREDSRSVPELAKAISYAGGSEELGTELTSAIPGTAGIRSALHSPRSEGGIISLVKRTFSVTELDAYLNCPYDYYVVNVLRIKPLEEVSEDISPLDRGSKIHAILRDFYRSWPGAVTGENRDDAFELLRKLARTAFAAEADTFRNRREKDRFLNVMADRFLAAEIGFWMQGMKPVYLEQKIEIPLVLPDGREIELSGKVDRIDADADGNFIIVDYKTGRYPAPKTGTDQDIFQLPVYAMMASHLGAADILPLKNPVGVAYYDLMGKTAAGARDVVLFNREAGNSHPSSKPRASAKSAAEFEAILKKSMVRAREAAAGILAGNFTGTPRDENKCRYCVNEMLCGRESG